MAKADFDELLAAMPQIAKAVNTFTSETVQADAFSALVAVLTGGSLPDGGQSSKRMPKEGNSAPDGSAKTKSQKQTAKRSAKKSTGKTPALAVDSSLDIAPKGIQSLQAFAEEKGAKSQQERSMVSIYWLGRVAKTEKVSIIAVYSCYKKMGWAAPANPRNQLQVLASRKHLLDTSDMDAIALTQAGVNFVDGMPVKGKAT